MGFYESVGVAAGVIALCVIVARVTRNMGFVSLLFHLCLGLAAGLLGLVPSSLTRSASVSGALMACVACVLFMGGYSTSLSAMRPAHVRGCVLGVAGTLVSTVVVGLATHALLGASLPASLALGACASCADMGVLMALVRGRHLGLRRSPAATLELEAGLSAPVCLLVLTFVTTLASSGPAEAAASTLRMALVGLACGGVGTLVAVGAMRLAQRRQSTVTATFACGLALVAVALPGLLGGEGCLGAWFVGLGAGNVPVKGRRQVAHFFDGLRTVIHMAALFACGLAASASDLAATLPAGLALFCVATVLARPLSTALVTSVHPSEKRERTFVATAGMRGPAALVLALTLATSVSGLRLMGALDALGVTFWVVALSLATQGFVVPALARRLRVTACGEDSSIRTFTDYEVSSDNTLVELEVRPGGWAGRTIAEVDFAPEALVVLVRRGADEIIPQGSTRLEAHDRIILSVPQYVRRPDDGVRLTEERIEEGHPWAGKTLAQLELPHDALAVLVRRDEDTLTPDGSTVLKPGDTLVLSSATRA